MYVNEVFDVIKFYNNDELVVKGIVDGGDEFDEYLHYFEGTTTFERLEDMFETIKLNPPESFTLYYPGGKIVIVDEED